MTKHEKYTIKNKTNKNWKKTWNNVVFRPQEVKMTNKVLREKSNCVVCRSNQSRFLKQKSKLTTVIKVR